ncbi:diacylglycerol kinase family protein [Ningiella sp. W23]|uniref:diacylglycerol kinase family protein n=1 Tax=Ningiella sp. W23 TaxID=3023715 RepID=UPI003756A910
MFIVKYYLLISVLSLLAAVFSPSWYFTVILAWVSLSLFAVSMAYITDSPWIFRKNDRGDIPLYIQWVFIPFLLGVQMYNSWQRKTDSVPPLQEIKPGIFLACRLFPSDIEILRKENVSAILDATAEFSGLIWSAQDEDLDYLNVPILDHKAPHKQDIEKAINWIHNHIRDNKSVVVHCALGRGRSVLIVAAYLIATNYSESVDAAIKLINGIRGTARLNKYQHRKLDAMHKEGLLSIKSRALLVANPSSGRQTWDDVQDQILQTLQQRYQVDVLLTQQNQPVEERCSREKITKFDAVFACGGDGTVNEVAQLVKESDTVLGIIPLGTTNALCHVLYGKRSKIAPVSTALEVINQQHQVTMDVAKCNNEILLLVAGIGVERDMIAGADKQRKSERGELAYLDALRLAFTDSTEKAYKLSINSMAPDIVLANSIVVANAAPATTILAQGSGKVDPFVGQLDVTILNLEQSVSEPVAKVLTQSVSGGNAQVGQSNAMRYMRAENVTIRLADESPIDYVIDGELRTAQTVKISVIPKALKLFAAASTIQRFETV